MKTTTKKLFVFLALSVLAFTSCNLSRNTCKWVSEDKIEIAQEGNNRSRDDIKKLTARTDYAVSSITTKKPNTGKLSKTYPIFNFKPILSKTKIALKGISTYSIVKFKKKEYERNTEGEEMGDIAWVGFPEIGVGVFLLFFNDLSVFPLGVIWIIGCMLVILGCLWLIVLGNSEQKLFGWAFLALFIGLITGFIGILLLAFGSLGATPGEISAGLILTLIGLLLLITALILLIIDLFKILSTD